MRAAILPILLLSTAAARATEPLPAVEASTTYSEIRIALALQGWTPDRQGRARGRCGGGTRVCATYAEAVGCRRTTPSRCLFVWSKNQTEIEIETIGSKPQVITVARLRCRTGCRPDEPPPPAP
ncbi:hypothetical protein [Methylobacterium sp. JK268]